LVKTLSKNFGGLHIGKELKRSSAGEQVEDEHNDGQDEEDVNPAAQRVAADESYDPEDE
jgi:hypothetical protein